MLYNIIGDIHGRDSWEKLVRDDCVNIFVGDYFSPYEDIPFEKQKDVFMSIIAYKEKHPETILLRGNHDLGGYVARPYNRDGHNSLAVNEILKEFEDKLQTAYSVENKALVTHAGVSFIWYDRYKNAQLMKLVVDCSYDDPDEIESPYTHEMVKMDNPVKYSDCKTPEEAYRRYCDRYKPYFAEENKKPVDKQFLKWNNQLWQYNKEAGRFVEFKTSPDEMAEYINGLWEKKRYSAFEFDYNSGPMDSYGDDERHSPLWIRPNALRYCNAFDFTDYWQIVGHTWTVHPFVSDKQHVAYVDCLQYNTESFIYNSETNKFTINKPE